MPVWWWPKCHLIIAAQNLVDLTQYRYPVFLTLFVDLLPKKCLKPSFTVTYTKGDNGYDLLLCFLQGAILRDCPIKNHQKNKKLSDFSPSFWLNLSVWLSYLLVLATVVVVVVVLETVTATLLAAVVAAVFSAGFWQPTSARPATAKLPNNEIFAFTWYS